MNAVRKMANGYMSLVGGANKYAHIALAEKALGKALPAGAQVHHVDEDPSNNTPTNLVICPNQRYHKLLHARQRVMDAGGSPGEHKICTTCQHLLPVEAFVKSSIRYDGLHMQCRNCVSEYKKRTGKSVGKWNERAKLLQRIRRARASIN